MGPQIKLQDYDKVDLNAPLRPVQWTDEQKAARPLPKTSTKVLVVSGQNTAVDDLVPRLLPLWKQLEGQKVMGREPVVLRLYSWESEGRDFIRRFAKVRRMIQRTTDDDAGGILMRLLNAFSDEVDEFDREGRKAGRSNPSIVDKAVELYKADCKKPDNRKYDNLAQLVKQVTVTPEKINTLRKPIITLVKMGPMAVSSSARRSEWQTGPSVRYSGPTMSSVTRAPATRRSHSSCSLHTTALRLTSASVTTSSCLS